jgi:hypothetical protein
LDGPDGQRSRGWAERGVHLDLLEVVEQGVEPGASEDPHPDRVRHRGAQAERSFDGEEDFDEDADPDEGFFEPPPFEPDDSDVPDEPEDDEADPLDSFEPPSPFEPPSLVAFDRDARESVA